MIVNSIKGLVQVDGKYSPVGHTFNCPICKSYRTYCSALLTMELNTPAWLCTECRYKFTLEDIQILSI